MSAHHRVKSPLTISEMRRIDALAGKAMGFDRTNTKSRLAATYKETAENCAA
jgi:hypothetical protein